MTARALRAASFIPMLAAASCAGGGPAPPVDLAPGPDGMITTASGLKYKAIRQAVGPKPTARDRVMLFYSCKLADGTVVDSSYEREQPDVFAVRDLVRGFQEALRLMSPGSHYEVIVPGRLGYGWRGIEGLVAPNETLYFEIELLRIIE